MLQLTHPRATSVDDNGSGEAAPKTNSNDNVVNEQIRRYPKRVLHRVAFRLLQQSGKNLANDASPKQIDQDETSTDLSFAFHSLSFCPGCLIQGQKSNTSLFSLAPADVTTADVLLLTTQAPWQQCTNDALLLHPLIHIVWVVIVSSFQPGKV